MVRAQGCCVECTILCLPLGNTRKKASFHAEKKPFCNAIIELSILIEQLVVVVIESYYERNGERRFAVVFDIQHKGVLYEVEVSAKLCQRHTVFQNGTVTGNVVAVNGNVHIASVLRNANEVLFKAKQLFLFEHDQLLTVGIFHVHFGKQDVEDLVAYAIENRFAFGVHNVFLFG